MRPTRVGQGIWGPMLLIPWLASQGHGQTQPIPANSKPPSSRRDEVQRIIKTIRDALERSMPRANTSDSKGQIDPANLPDPAPPRSIHQACYQGLLPVVRRLVNSDPGIAWQLHESGFSPLEAAIIGGHSEIVDLLLQSGVSPRELLPIGRTPLAFAISCGKVSIVQLLMKRGAGPDRSGGCRCEERGRAPPPLEASTSPGR